MSDPLAGNLVVVGVQWGDEGKAKVTDLLAGDVDIVARFQGGNNAGHTIVHNQNKLVLHLVPCGVLRERVGVIGNGVVFDPEILISEMETIRKFGVEVSPRLLKISPLAHMIFPYHRRWDSIREYLESSAIGTTRRGIGPAYADKARRVGFRLGELQNPALFREKLIRVVAEENQTLQAVGESETIDAKELAERYLEMGETLLPYTTDVSEFLSGELLKGRRVLFEGAQGALLDVDHGTYPFVTSSHTLAAQAACGTGISPKFLTTILGISKVYSTRVGSGPFPTEEGGELGQIIQARGGEYGSTTGRPRRCGWLDLVALKKAIRLNGVDALALTKLDVLSGMESVSVAVRYRTASGETTDRFPDFPWEFDGLTPVYQTLPGWSEELSNVRSRSNLPMQAQGLIQLIEKETRTPVRLISVGAEREQTIHCT